jgi:hypothetical protein
MKVIIGLAVILGAGAAALLAFTVCVGAGAVHAPDGLLRFAGAFSWALALSAPVVVFLAVWGRLYLAFLRYLDRGHRHPGTP